MNEHQLIKESLTNSSAEPFNAKCKTSYITALYNP